MNEHVVLVDADGRPVLRYLVGSREGRPAARQVEVLGSGAAEVVLAELPGWYVMCPPELGRELLGLGASTFRHGYGLERDLIADPPPPDWAEVLPAPPLRVEPLRHSAEQVRRAWTAAYHTGHVDYRDGSIEPMRRLLAGASMGAVLSCSQVVTDRGEVVAGLVANANEGRPWICEVFRDPAPAYAGLGGLLLRRAVAAAAADGLSTIGLAVTEGNPARRLYESLGFVVNEEIITVLLPEPRS